MARIPTLDANDDGWTDWQMPVRHYRMACCDCGLVHNIEFRVVTVGRRTKEGYALKKLNPAGCRVEFRVSRNNRSTGQERRHRRKTK